MYEAPHRAGPHWSRESQPGLSGGVEQFSHADKLGCSVFVIVCREQGRRHTPSTQRRHADAVSSALPGRADQVLADPGWDVLAATLDEAERAGYGPTTLLQGVIGQRELRSADNVTDVLVWRLRRTAKLPAAPGSAPQRPGTKTLSVRQVAAAHTDATGRAAAGVNRRPRR